ncbi:MAG TPA: prepilin-type N-terminal cleavage/methylation domain-containing protein [Verrucomicrobiae bacterium]|jgi:prepilin-type N-terminal cleavage/methylation domain-containing protein|nr:prepilin-type N-terminal cleavage/methylation domain-containing protein [Verrucomicrobiae bacterium]
MLLVFQRKNDGRLAQRAFTLVELTVVIAITAILAALLLPSLSSAREKSSRAVCKSNLRQTLMALRMYADSSAENLPSSADNMGYYHAIRLSDAVFTNFVGDYLSGVSNVLYCPNVDYSGVPTHDAKGYIIGYSYLANSIITTEKSPDYWVGTTKMNGPGTNELLADANYWSSESVGVNNTSVQMAPHTMTGANIVQTPTATRAAPTTSKSQTLGARGGNIGRADMSVTWKGIQNMGEYQASDRGDAGGNW